MAVNKHSFTNPFTSHPQFAHLKAHNSDFSRLYDELQSVDSEVTSIEKSATNADNTYLIARKLRRGNLQHALQQLVGITD